MKKKHKVKNRFSRFNIFTKVVSNILAFKLILTFFNQDNPAFDVHGAMLLPLPNHSHIVMGNDVSIWVDDEAQATEILSKIWVVKDGLSQNSDISTLIRICGLDRQEGLMPPC